jgi:hypothetical protein
MSELNFDETIINRINVDIKEILGKKESIFLYDPNNRQILLKQDGTILPNDTIENNINVNFRNSECKKNALLNTMTDLISKQVCFRDENILYIKRFQTLINNMFNNAISSYIELKKNQGAILDNNDIVFLYKGGTTMKIMYEKYRKELESFPQFTKFFDYMKTFFERSDSDYSVMISPFITQEKNNISFQRVYFEINKIVYFCLDEIRQTFYNYSNFFIPFDHITDKIMFNKINEQNKQLNEIKEKIDINNCVNLQIIDEIIGITFVNEKRQNNIGFNAMDRGEINIFLEGKNIPPNMTENMIDDTFLDLTNINKLRNKEFIERKSVSSRIQDYIL